jgi:MarR family transcriptional regulator, organic hydroperoxide resistance regulator
MPARALLMTGRGSSRCRRPVSPSHDPADFVVSFVKTFKALQDTLTKTLAEYGVHPGQNMMLSALANDDGRTPGELAERLGITGPTVVKAAQRMETAGLVDRRRDDKDGRLVRIYLTERGRSVVQPIEDDIRAIGERVTAALTPEQRDTLLAALATVFETLQAGPAS